MLIEVLGIVLLAVKQVVYAKATEELISFLSSVFLWLLSTIILPVLEFYIGLRVREYHIRALQEELRMIEAEQGDIRELIRALQRQQRVAQDLNEPDRGA